MKGLSIKGEVHVGRVEYKVLFSQLLKDFRELPIETQIAMIDEMILATGNCENLSKIHRSMLKLSLKNTMGLLEENNNNE